MRARLASPEGARLDGEPPLFGRPAPSLVSTPEQHVQWISRWRYFGEWGFQDPWGMQEPQRRRCERFARIHLRRPAAGWCYAPLLKRQRDGSIVEHTDEDDDIAGNGIEDDDCDKRVFCLARQTLSLADLSDATLTWHNDRIYANTQPDAAWVGTRAVSAYLAYTRRNAMGMFENERLIVDAYMPARLANKQFNFDEVASPRAATTMVSLLASDAERAAWHAVVAFMRTGTSAYKIPKKLRPGTKPGVVKPEFTAASDAMDRCSPDHTVRYVLGVPLAHLMLVCAGVERLYSRYVSRFGFLSVPEMLRTAENGATVFDVACDAWRRHWKQESGRATSALSATPLPFAWPDAIVGPMQTDGDTIDAMTVRMFGTLGAVLTPTRMDLINFAGHSRAVALLPAAALSGFAMYVRECERVCGVAGRNHAAPRGLSLLHAVAARACARTPAVLRYIISTGNGRAGFAIDLVYTTDEMRTLGVRAGDTPLSAALRNGAAENASLLLEVGASPRRHDPVSGETPLHAFVAAASASTRAPATLETMSLMCDRLLPTLTRVDVNARTRNEMADDDETASDRSPLDDVMESPMAGATRLALLERLVRAGAVARACDARGLTPLHRAAAHGYVAEARFLIDNGASLAALYGGKTPLEVAVEMHGDDGELLQVLGTMMMTTTTTATATATTK